MSKNEKQRVEIQPESGFLVDQFHGCPFSYPFSNNKNIIDIEGVLVDCALSATFTTKKYAIHVQVNGEGAVSPSMLDELSHGDTQTWVFTPKEGFLFMDVSGCSGKKEGNTYKVGPIVEDCHVMASFAKKTYSLQTTISGKGIITPPLPQDILHGDTLSFSLVPDAGFTLDTVSGCDATTSGDLLYAFSITENCDLSIVFISNKEHALKKIMSSSQANSANNIVLDDLSYFTTVDQLIDDNLHAYQLTIANNTPDKFNSSEKIAQIIEVINRYNHDQYSYAQTSLIKHKDEGRIAPLLISGRDMLVVYHAVGGAINAAWVDVFLSDERVGQVSMLPPSEFPAILESSFLHTDKLSTSNHTDWTVSIPWYVVNKNLRISVSFDINGTRFYLNKINPNIYVDEQYYLRSFNKIILWADRDYPFAYANKRQSYARDYFAITPFSQLISADYTTALWPYIAWPNSSPNTINSMQALIDSGESENTYGILKNHFTQRVMLANTGQGLKKMPLDAHSRYSSANYSASGLRQKKDNKYDNIHQGGAAGGWSGWTALWGDDPSIYAHEIGHNFYRSHWFSQSNSSSVYFTDAAVAEYPHPNGEYLSLPPRSYDTTRQQFRAWQRIKNGDFVGYRESGVPLGIRDYMSYERDSSHGSVFLPYTPLTTKGIQDALLNKPVIRSVNGKPGTYLWNAISLQYEAIDDSQLTRSIESIGVPVATIIGTLSLNEETQRMQPPIYNRYGYTYKFEENLADVSSVFPFYIKISYENSQQYASIDTEPSNDIQLFSFNLNMAKKPVKVELFNHNNHLTPVFHQNIESTLPIETPIVHFMGKGVNVPLKRIIFHESCLDNKCLVDRAPIEWTIEPKNGYVQFVFEDELVSVQHDDSYSKITLNAYSGKKIAELKASRHKTGEASTRSLNRQPKEWKIGDKESITWFDYSVYDSDQSFSSIIKLLNDQSELFAMEKFEIEVTEQWQSEHTISSASFTSYNYALDVEESTVFYTVPSQYFASGPDIGVWEHDGNSKITVQLLHENTQKFHEVTFTAKKVSMLMNSGSFYYTKSNYGPLTIEYDASNNLPIGDYFGILIINVKNWHGDSGSQLNKNLYFSIQVQI